MTILLMAVAGFVAGFVFDEAIARLSREPYERGELEEDDIRLKKDGGASLELNSETGALAMPRALTTASVYRRAIVVAATTALFALVGLRYSDPADLAVIAAWVSVLIICTGTDILAYRVPNVITYPAIVAAIVLSTVVLDASTANVLVGGALTGGTFLAMSIFSRGGMGMGDVKLAAFSGFALGLEFGVIALLITAILGGVVALALLLTRIRDRRDPIPYAPFIALGTVYVLLMQGAAFVEL